MPNGNMASASASSSAQPQNGTPTSAAEPRPSSGSSQRRQQGVSCDACKFRKVKCDRRAKVEKKLAELAAAGAPSTLSAAEDRDVSCSVCTSHGLRCTFTQAEPKKRRGRRIVEIQAQQKRQGSLSAAADGTAAPEADANGLQGRARHISSYPSPSSTPSTALGLFSVPGLTRSLLDACVVAYFKYCVPVVAVLHADTFSARYARYFAEYAGQPHVPASHVDPALASLPPLTELQILAVGCAGAGLLQPPITGANPRAKFKLQERLAQRCHEILQNVSWAQRLKEEGTDLVEAVYILVDPTAASVTGDLEYAHKQGVMKVPTDPLHVQPTSHEAVVRLALALCLHRRPKAEPGAAPDGPRWRTASGELIDDREMFRRVRLFWNCVAQDSFRSFGAHRTPLISEDQYDQDLPRWRDRGEGAFSTTFGMAANQDTFFSPQGRGFTSGPGSDGDPYPAAAGPQYPRFSRFDAVWLEALLRLCFITRTVGARTVSPRAQGRGVLLSDLDHALSAFGLWMAQLPQEITWEVQMADQHPDQTLHNITFRNALKTAWLEILAKGQVLSLWAAVKDYGLRAETDVLDAAGALASRLTISEPHMHERHASGSSPSHSATPGSMHPDAGAHHGAPDVERELRARLQGLTTDCFFRMAHLCSNAAAFGFMRASRQVMRDVTCSYAMWGCSLANDILKGIAAPRLGAQVHYDQVIEAVASLIEAVNSVDSVRDTHVMVRGLRDILHKFPGGREAGKRVRGETTSPPSDAKTPPQAALHHLSAAAVAQRGRSESTPWYPPQGFGTVCGEGDMSQQAAALPTRQANDEIAALSSNADALFDMGHGGQSAPELLDAQWLEQLTAGSAPHPPPMRDPVAGAPPLEHPGARMMHGGPVPAHLETQWNAPEVMQQQQQQSRGASDMLRDAQAWAGQAWDGIGQTQEPQGSYEWLGTWR